VKNTTLARTLTTLGALALHHVARTLMRVAKGIKPTDVYIPEDAPVSFTTSPWDTTQHNTLVIEDRVTPISVYETNVHTLPLGVTVAITFDNTNNGSEESHVYVLLNDMRDPMALYGRDEEGYFFEEDMREVV
jgi:hypothetical protein